MTEQAPHIQTVGAAWTHATRPGQTGRQSHQADQTADLRHLGLIERIEVLLAKELGSRVTRDFLLLGVGAHVHVVQNFQLAAPQADRPGFVIIHRSGDRRRLLERPHTEKGAKRPIQDRQLFPPPREVDADDRPQVIEPAHLDQAERSEEGKHPRRPGIKP